MSHLSAVDAYLSGLDADWRSPAPGEWGLTLDDVGGWPLHVGLRARDGLLAVQAEVRGPGEVDRAWMLHANRRGSLVRYAESRAGAVWVHAELPLSALDWLDRVLGAVAEAAAAARSAATPRGSGERRRRDSGDSRRARA